MKGSALVVATLLHLKGCKDGACLGIAFESPGLAESRELLRIHDDPNDFDAGRRLEGREAALRLLLPLIERPEEGVCIVHDLEDARIVLASEPSDADGFRFHDGLNLYFADDQAEVAA